MGTPSLGMVVYSQLWDEIACDCPVLPHERELPWVLVEGCGGAMGSSGRMWWGTGHISSVWKLCEVSHCKNTDTGWFLLGQQAL